MHVIWCDWLKTQIALFRDQDEAIDALYEDDKLFEKYENGKAGYSNGKDNDKLPMFFIYIARKIDASTTLDGLIVHEVTHLVDILLNYKGVETSSVNTEVKAHMNEWLFGEVSRLIKKGRKKK
jgi:hypothetical protein